MFLISGGSAPAADSWQCVGIRKRRTFFALSENWVLASLWQPRPNQMSNSSHQDVSILAASSARKKEENKARNWAFQSCWSFPNTTIHEETFDGRKEQVFNEIKRRIFILMERAGVLPKIQYMNIVIDYTCLGAISATYNISLRC